MATPCLLIDIGNSALKFVCYELATGTYLSPPRSLSWRDVYDSPESLQEFRSLCSGCGMAVVSSVNRPHAGHLEKLAFAAGLPCWRFVTCEDLAMPVAVPRPQEVGIDRLLAASAARERLGGGAPLVVLQVGTAITVDLVDAAGAFRGGVILPSETTLYNALAEKTDRLPRLARQPDAADLIDRTPGEEILYAPTSAAAALPPGADTVAAIRLGVESCVRGGVLRTYRQYCQSLGVEPRVAATGGGAASLAAELQPHARLYSNLVLCGLAAVAERVGRP